MTRYELPRLCALNFVIDRVLDGGVNASLNLDGHGKSLSFRLLELEIEIGRGDGGNHGQSQGGETMKRLMLTAAALAALSLAATAPAGAQNKRLLIGSTSASSSQYGYFVALGQLINDKVPGVTASVAETGATLDNLRRMQRGQVDLGLVTTNVVQHAWEGTDEFEGHAQKAPILFVYSPAPQNVVVRKDAGVSKLADLDGKRFNPGIRGSATEATAEAVFKTLGITPDYVRGSTTDVVDQVKDNRLVGYVKSGAGEKLDASSLDINTFTPISVVSLSDEQAATRCARR